MTRPTATGAPRVALHDALARWGPWLTVLAGPLQVPVGVLVLRLDAAIGPLRPRSPRPGGDPDGYRGLSRRGPYDRLLLSEWALLDEAPDEFIRRAATREHAFLELDRRTPTEGIACEATFDAGPESLGSPRLVHIALLLVLARRASLAGARFTWRIAQEGDEGPVREGVDGPGILALVRARSAVPARASGDKTAMNADERWRIGGPTVRVWGRDAGRATVRRVVVEDVIAHRTDEDGDAVDVTVEGAGRATTVRLALPAANLRRRLITDPTAGEPTFVPTSTAERTWRAFPAGVRGPTEVRFLPGTRQLAGIFDDGVVLTWSTANLGPKQPRPQFGEYGPTSSYIAVGYVRQRILGVRQDGARFQIFGRGIDVSWTAGPEGAPTRGPHVGHALVHEGRIVFTDDSGDLWAVTPHPRAAPKVERLGAWVVAMRVTLGRLWWIEEDVAQPDTTFVLRNIRPDGTPSEALPLTNGWVEADFVAPAWDGGPWVVAWGDGTDVLHLGAPYATGGVLGAAPGINRVPDVRRPSGTLVGVAPVKGGYSVLTWDAVAGVLRELRPDAAGQTVASVLVLPRAPVAHALSWDGRLIAFTTAERTLEVWDIEAGKPLMLRHERT